MSENADCPSPDQLHRALTGELPPDRVHAIEQHLLECGACAEQTLHSGDLQTYSQALRESAQRGAVVVSSTDAEQLEQLIDRVRSLPHQQEATQLSGVTKGSGDTDLESDLIRYLQPARADEELGWLGTYRVLKLLGSGGMGGVFLAEDTQLHRRVALKVMRPDISGQANADERFLREARAAAAVHHDHIVTIFQVGRDGQVPFLSMEFLEGESLEDRLRRERVMPLADILRIGREIAEGLAAAHARGLVHRDIKPANIWLESRGGHLPNSSNEVVPPRVKLLDFGLARSADVNFELTSQGMVIGTPAYMAPEQAAGDMLDHRADLFSLGIVLYRLATGGLPFQGKDAIATLVAIRSDTPGDPRKLRSDLPPALCDLIIQLLHKNPAERPVSAAEVARRLAEIPLSVRPDPVPRDTPTVAYQRQPPGKSRTFKWIATAGAIFFLCLMGVIVVVTTDGGRVEVNSKVDDVNLEVFLTPENGTAIKAFDTKTGSQVEWFWSGKYEVAIKGDTNSVQLDKQKLTLKRGVTEILTLTRKPNANSSPTAGSKPQIINANLKMAPPASVPEPPSLNEWLKGRKVLTVVQDGSGQFKTIQAALDALQPGEVVKVLDKGPYREWLDVPTLPQDSGLITQVQTILEGPEWKPHYQQVDSATGGKVDVYRGHVLNGANGFRLHGFEMQFPPSNGKRVRRLGEKHTKSFVLENCFIHASESVEGEPVAIADWEDSGDGVGMSVWMRECVIEGSVALFALHKRLPPDPDRLSTVVVERNYFLGVGTLNHLMVAGQSIKKLLIRHNVFAGKSGVDIQLTHVDATDSLEVSNNLLLSPTGIIFQESTPHGAVTIRNNLHTWDAVVGFTVGAKLPQAAQSWNLDHNAYPNSRAGASPENVLPRPPGDIAVLPRFLSKVPQETDYLRIPADDPLATAGAGGQWPKYIGPLPPGPAPKEGDWFLRLRERWNSIPPMTEGGNNYELDLSAKTDNGFARAEIADELQLDRPCTVEMFVTPRTVSAAAINRGLFASLGGLTLKQGYSMDPVSGRPQAIPSWQWLLLEDAGNHEVADSTRFVPKRRVHLAGVYSPANLKLFVDGQLAATAPLTSPARRKAGRVAIGYGTPASNWEPFDGTVDEVRISTTARYDANFTPPIRFEPDDKTWGLYHCDEGSGDVLKDSSGHGRDGKVLGATWVPVKASTVPPPIAIPEHPPLAEWLEGRKVLTVAQDGSGQFKTINEAIQQLRSGQTIKVMDRGPYREVIDLASPPKDSGLISSRETVIELPNWIEDPQVGSGVRGHRISSTDGFRLSGLTWLSPPGEKGDLLSLWLPNGLIMERCVFRSATKTAVLVQFDPQPRLQTVHIRECGFFDGLLLLGGDARHGRLVIENNYFHKRGSLMSWQVGRFGRLIFRHNVCDYFGPKFHGLTETSDGIELSNNTILAPATQFSEAAPAQGVTIRNNIVQYGVLVSNSAGTLVPPAQWRVDHNGYLEYGKGDFKPFVPQSPTDVTQDPDFLSVDSTHRDYARIPANAPAGTAGAGGDWPGYIGALPPGPAPATGDWFTRLQERWPVNQDGM